MRNHIYQMIMRHIAFLESIQEITNKMLEGLENGNFVTISTDAQNRTRMTNILQQFQQEVYECRKNEITFQRDPELMEVFNLWNLEVSIILEQVNQKDELISQLLEQEKLKATEEISKTHSNKEKLSGYNLSSVKK